MSNQNVSKWIASFAVISLVLLACISTGKTQKVSPISGTIVLETDTIPPRILNIDSVRSMVYDSEQVDLLKKAGVPCRVEVAIRVDANGLYSGHHILSMCHPMLKELIDQKVKYFRFAPAQVDGRSVPHKLVTYFSWTTK